MSENNISQIKDLKKTGFYLSIQTNKLNQSFSWTACMLSWIAGGVWPHGSKWSRLAWINLHDRFVLKTKMCIYSWFHCSYLQTEMSLLKVLYILKCELWGFGLLFAVINRRTTATPTHAQNADFSECERNYTCLAILNFVSVAFAIRQSLKHPMKMYRAFPELD